MLKYRKYTFGGFILVVAFVGALFVNATPNSIKNMSVDQIVYYSKQFSQKRNQPGFSSSSLEFLDRHKRVISNYLAIRAKVPTCQALLNLDSSTITGVYKLFPPNKKAVITLCEIQDNLVVKSIELAEKKKSLVCGINKKCLTEDDFYKRVTCGNTDSSATTLCPVEGVLGEPVLIKKLSGTCGDRDYGYDDNSNALWTKNRCSGDFQMFLVPQAFAPVIVGNIDVAEYMQGEFVVRGWACLAKSSSPITVELYIGGAKGKGQLSATSVANIPSEPAVGFECGTQAVGHRFQFKLPMASMAAKGNSPIFVHGLVPEAQGGGDYEIAGSGQRKVPAFSKLMRGYIDTVALEDNQLAVYGWACVEGLVSSIDVHLYINNEAGKNGAVLLGGATANLVNAIGVDQACHTEGVAHRYRLKLPIDTAKMIAGRPLYVHGVSPIAGVNNSALVHSGTFQMPSLPVSNSAIGWVDLVQYSKGQMNIFGWACHKGLAQFSKVQVVAVSPTGVKVQLGVGVANVTNETAVDTACGTKGVGHRYKLLALPAMGIDPTKIKIYANVLPLYPWELPIPLKGSGTVSIQISP